jgi:hypothetical protein
MTHGTYKSFIHRTHNIRFRAGAKGSKLLFGNLHADTFFACSEVSLLFSADDVSGVGVEMRFKRPFLTFGLGISS